MHIMLAHGRQRQENQILKLANTTQRFEASTGYETLSQKTNWAWRGIPLIPALGSQKQADLDHVSSRPVFEAWSTERVPGLHRLTLSQKNKIQKHTSKQVKTESPSRNSSLLPTPGLLSSGIKAGAQLCFQTLGQHGLQLQPTHIFNIHCYSLTLPFALYK